MPYARKGGGGPVCRVVRLRDMDLIQINVELHVLLLRRILVDRIARVIL